MPDGQIVRGLDAVRAHVADWRSGWRDFQEEVEDVLEAGNRVVIFYCDRGIGRSSGVETEIRYASVWDVRDGKIARMKNFLNRDEAVRDATPGIDSQ